MTCELARSAVHGYFDGELDAVRASEFERHLENCPECQTSMNELEEMRDACSRAISIRKRPPGWSREFASNFRTRISGGMLEGRGDRGS